MQSKKINLLSLTVIFFVITTVIILRFYAILPKAFYGDDLANFICYLDGSGYTPSTFLLSVANKYRPVMNFIFMLEVNLFATKIKWYVFFNIFIYSLSVLLLFLLLKKITENSIISILLSLSLASSRFAGFIITQIIGGPLEGAAFFMMLLIVYLLYSSCNNRKNTIKNGIISLVLLFLIIHTHERYIVLSVWMFFVFTITPPFQRIQEKYKRALLIATILIPLFSLLIKLYLIKVPILIGSGNIHIDFNLAQITSNITEGALSIVGVNSGPDYLVGASVTHLEFFPYKLLAIFNLLSIPLLIYSILITRDKSDYIWPSLFIFLAFLMLLSGSVTIRMEQRWILGSYALFIISIGWALSMFLRRQRKFMAYFLLFVFFFSAVLTDSKLMKFFNRVYYVQSSKFAELVKRDVSEKYFIENASKIYFVTGNEHCKWTLLDGNFFRIYNHNSQKIECINSSLIDQIPKDKTVYIFDGPNEVGLTRVGK